MSTYQESEYTEASPKKYPTEFTREGMKHQEVKRIGRVALYSVAEVGFEVVVIKIAKPQKLPNGETAPWRETYPGNEEFGRRGWYFMKSEKDGAQAKFEELVHEEIKGDGKDK